MLNNQSIKTRILNKAAQYANDVSLVNSSEEILTNGSTFAEKQDSVIYLVATTSINGTVVNIRFSGIEERVN